MSQHSGRADPEQQPDVYTAHREQLLWAEWEEEYTVYNRATGETHVLGAFPTEILASLSVQAADLHQLAEQLATTCGIECSREWTGKTAESLRLLHSLELVEKIPSRPPSRT